MAQFDFPTSPSNGQVYTANGVTFTYSTTAGGWIGGPMVDTGVFQPKDANLTAIAGLADAAIGLPEFDGVGGAAVRPVATIAEFRAGTATPRVLPNKGVWDAAAFVTVPYAASVALDLTTGINFSTLVVTGPITLANPAAMGPFGRCGSYVLQAAADQTLAFGAQWLFPGGTKPTGLLAGKPTSIFYEILDATRLLCAAAEAYA